LILLITGSLDGTADLLVSKVGSSNIFRFNYDLFNEYHLEFSPSYWEIRNPTGHTINSNTVSSAFWWKAFNFYIQDQEEFLVEEIKYIYREIYHWCRLKGITKGNPHDFHNQLGKLNILNVASKYFQIPKTLVTFKLAGVDTFANNQVVAKSLTSGLTTTNKALFTSAVNLKQLHPNYPWFLQEQLNSEVDITIFICGEKYFAYYRDRSDLVGLDWRKEQNFDNPLAKEWIRFQLTNPQQQSISKFNQELSVDWGRIDFMGSVDELVFLEFNANGQWVFLDYSGEDGLVSTVAQYLLN
jgi:hypothetical protein